MKELSDTGFQGKHFFPSHSDAGPNNCYLTRNDSVFVLLCVIATLAVCGKKG